jgi:hypothetical protein
MEKGIKNALSPDFDINLTYGNFVEILSVEVLQTL